MRDLKIDSEKGSKNCAGPVYNGWPAKSIPGCMGSDKIYYSLKGKPDKKYPFETFVFKLDDFFVDETPSSPVPAVLSSCSAYPRKLDLYGTLLEKEQAQNLDRMDPHDQVELWDASWDELVSDVGLLDMLVEYANHLEYCPRRGTYILSFGLNSGRGHEKQDNSSFGVADVQFLRHTKDPLVVKAFVGASKISARLGLPFATDLEDLLEHDEVNQTRNEFGAWMIDPNNCWEGGSLLLGPVRPRTQKEKVAWETEMLDAGYKKTLSDADTVLDPEHQPTQEDDMEPVKDYDDVSCDFTDNSDGSHMSELDDMVSVTPEDEASATPEKKVNWLKLESIFSKVITDGKRRAKEKAAAGATKAKGGSDKLVAEGSMSMVGSHGDHFNCDHLPWSQSVSQIVFIPFLGLMRINFQVYFRSSVFVASLKKLVVMEILEKVRLQACRLPRQLKMFDETHLQLGDCGYLPVFCNRTGEIVDIGLLTTVSPDKFGRHTFPFIYYVDLLIRKYPTLRTKYGLTGLYQCLLYSCNMGTVLYTLRRMLGEDRMREQKSHLEYGSLGCLILEIIANFGSIHKHGSLRCSVWSGNCLPYAQHRNTCGKPLDMDVSFTEGFDRLKPNEMANSTTKAVDDLEASGPCVSQLGAAACLQAHSAGGLFHCKSLPKITPFCPGSSNFKKATATKSLEKQTPMLDRYKEEAGHNHRKKNGRDDCKTSLYSFAVGGIISCVDKEFSGEVFDGLPREQQVVEELLCMALRYKQAYDIHFPGQPISVWRDGQLMYHCIKLTKEGHDSGFENSRRFEPVQLKTTGKVPEAFQPDGYLKPQRRQEIKRGLVPDLPFVVDALGDYSMVTLFHSDLKYDNNSTGYIKKQVRSSTQPLANLAERGLLTDMAVAGRKKIIQSLMTQTRKGNKPGAEDKAKSHLISLSEVPLFKEAMTKLQLQRVTEWKQENNQEVVPGEEHGDNKSNSEVGIRKRPRGRPKKKASKADAFRKDTDSSSSESEDGRPAGKKSRGTSTGRGRPKRKTNSKRKHIPDEAESDSDHKEGNEDNASDGGSGGSEGDSGDSGDGDNGGGSDGGGSGDDDKSDEDGGDGVDSLADSGSSDEEEETDAFIPSAV